jgi:small GTP-binding protein
MTESNFHGAPVQKYKIVLIGDSTVGKTSLINAYLRHDGLHSSTVGATCTTFVSTVDDRPVQLHIWDTAGQDTFRNLVPVYARGAHAAIIVFAQNKLESFIHLKDWHALIVEKVGDIPFVVARNKSDQKAEVDIDVSDAWARTRGFPIISTSATQKMNVDHLFEVVVKLLKEKQHPPAESLPLVPPAAKKPPLGHSDCCP